MRRLPRSRPLEPRRSIPIAIALLLGASIASYGQEDARTCTARGDDHAESGDLNRAIADYTEAIKLDPRYAPAYSRRASAWVKKHEYRRAIADYTAAIQLEPDQPATYLLRGSAWSRQGDHAPAMADFDQAIRLAPNDAGAYIARASEWEKDLKAEQALADYQRAIALDPRSIPAYEGRGRIWRKGGENEKVVANFAALARMLPDDPIGHRELAWILATCDKDSIREGGRALREATAACELTKWADPGCLEALAAACAEVGDFESAVDWQTRALEIFAANNDRVDRRLIAKKRQDADMNHRLYRYRRRMAYHERPDGAAR